MRLPLLALHICAGIVGLLSTLSQGAAVQTQGFAIDASIRSTGATGSSSNRSTCAGTCALQGSRLNSQGSGASDAKRRSWL